MTSGLTGQKSQVVSCGGGAGYIIHRDHVCSPVCCSSDTSLHVPAGSGGASWRGPLRACRQPRATWGAGDAGRGPRRTYDRRASHPAPRGTRRGAPRERSRPARPATAARRLNEALVDVAPPPRGEPGRQCARTATAQRDPTSPAGRASSPVRVLLALRSRCPLEGRRASKVAEPRVRPSHPKPICETLVRDSAEVQLRRVACNVRSLDPQ